MREEEAYRCQEESHCQSWRKNRGITGLVGHSIKSIIHSERTREIVLLSQKLKSNKRNLSFIVVWEGKYFLVKYEHS